jgi:UDP-N-acetylmuramate--alanine ligase
MSKQLIRFLQPGKKAHFIGVGGIGMSGVARLLLDQHLCVSGSDAKMSPTLSKLRMEGISVTVGHRGEYIERPDFVVYSSAITKSNPDLKCARDYGIPIFHRAEVLAALMNEAISIAVTGTHGKTTSAAMASFLLSESGLRPTCVVGGELLNFRSNIILGNSHFFVAEIDESDRSHLRFSPDLALVTSLEEEHLDQYDGIGDLKKSFGSFVKQVERTGRVIYCLDDKHIRDVMSKSEANATTYGLSPGADFSGFGSTFTLHERGKRIETVELKIPGLHNVANSLGVIALLRSFGLAHDQFLSHLANFRGVGRRLEVKLNRPELLIIDDYAHHPSEVKAGLMALAGMRKKTTAVFQPHRFSRTAGLASAFSDVFASAERVFLTDIYGAGEANPTSVGVDLIFNAVKHSGHRDVQVVSREKLIDVISSSISDEETIAFMGAGDIGEIADEFAGRFESTYSQ